MAEILPDPDETPGPRARRSASIVCDCCGCTLGADGGIIKTGDRAKKLARIEDKFDTLTAELAEEKERHAKTATRLSEVERELQAPDRETAESRY